MSKETKVTAYMQQLSAALRLLAQPSERTPPPLVEPAPTAFGAQEYAVEWRIELYADSPETAARKALAIQRDPRSTATVFHVATPEGFIPIDLTLLDETSTL